MPKYEYQGATDQIHRITLDSAITQATWDRPFASVSEKVEALVYTQFVGNNSDIRLTIRNKNGKRLSRIEGVVYGNKFKGIWTVPDRAKEAVYFEAEMKKHGLKKKSEEMEIIPLIKITNARWGQDIVRRQDIVKLTADVTDAPEGIEALIEIYEHDDGGAHDLVTKLKTLVNNKKVETEWQFDYQGDTKDILTAAESPTGYSPPKYLFKVIIGRSNAESGLMEFKDWMEIKLVDASDNPVGEWDYILHLADGQKRNGKLDKVGYAREEDIPPGKVSVELPDAKAPELIE